MWTVDDLRRLAATRNENLPVNSKVGRALLAHERMHGRTEEHFDKNDAKNTLRNLLAQMDRADLPKVQPPEYHGLKEFRSYAEEHFRARDAQREQQARARASTVLAHTTPPPLPPAKEPAMEEDRER